MTKGGSSNAEQDLVEWGVLVRAPRLSLSPPFRQSLARAAAGLQAAEQAMDAPIKGHPLTNAIERALHAHPLPEGAEPGPEHVSVAFAVEASNLPPRAAEMMGLESDP